MKELNLRLVVEIERSEGPDPFRDISIGVNPQSSKSRGYIGRLIGSSDWPKGPAPIVYLYLWMNRDPAKQLAKVGTPGDLLRAFKPQDLFYVGERKSLSNFKNGWLPGIPDKRKHDRSGDSRYHWLGFAHRRQIYAVIYKLPSNPDYKIDQKRRSLEYLVANDFLDRYKDDRRVLERGREYQRHPGWIRSNDVIRDAKWIVADIKSRFGI